MKTVFNVILGLCALVLIYICYTSIMGPINFEKAKKHRDAAVIARLIDIVKHNWNIVLYMTSNILQASTL